jgi:hypothetical protein
MCWFCGEATRPLTKAEVVGGAESNELEDAGRELREMGLALSVELMKLAGHLPYRST